MPTIIHSPLITQELIDKAEEENKKMAGYLTSLKKFGLCGSGDDAESLTALKRFLREHNIDYECSKRNMVWLKNKISESLVKSFLKD